MTYLTRILLAAALFGLAGCSSTRTSSMPMPEEMAAGAPREMLREGRALATTECGACHRLYRPEEYPARAWPHIAANMGRRAALSREQMEAVAAYYETAAMHPEAP